MSTTCTKLKVYKQLFLYYCYVFNFLYYIIKYKQITKLKKIAIDFNKKNIIINSE